MAIATPVIAFGDPGTARVATVGINPSPREFVDRHGQPLKGSTRRLATLCSLGADRLDELTDAQADEVLRECVSYFGRSPYRQWFDKLEAILGRACDASYYKGSACDLDFGAMGDRPSMGQIEATAQERLLTAGLPLLRAQLDHHALEPVLINGRSVVDAVRSAESRGRRQLWHPREREGRRPVSTSERNSGCRLAVKRCALGPAGRWFGDGGAEHPLGGSDVGHG
ncbi:MAG: hypothetical protein ACXVXL_28375, partial [Solirubrobacteraceae bacterium]